MYINDTKEDLFIVTDDPEETVFETILTSGDIRFSNIHTDDDVLGFMKGLYKRRLVRDVDSFREKIILSDNNYDDRIIELMKLSLSELIEKESHTPVYRIFLEDTAGGQLEFTAIMGAKAPYDYITIKSAVIVYNQYRDKYLKNLGRPKEDEYISTDQKWAKKSGLLKDEDAGFVVPMRETKFMRCMCLSVRPAKGVSHAHLASNSRDPGSGTMNTRSHITQFVKFANPYVSLSGKAISVTVGVSHAHPASCKLYHRKIYRNIGEMLLYTMLAGCQFTIDIE